MRRLAMLGLVFVAAILSCGKDVTGPLGAAARYASGLSWDAIFPPAFQQAGGAAGSLVPFTSVHVVLHHSDGTVALDTTIIFPADSTSYTADLTVKLLDGAPTAGEPMTLNLGYLNAAGETVFSGGPVNVTAAPPPPGGGANPPVQVPVQYTGPGASAVGVQISPRAGAALSGGSFTFSAVAVDASGNAVPNTPIVWSSLNSAIASVASAASGTVVAGATRGTATIVAQLLTGPSDQVSFSVSLPASQLLATSATQLTGIVGTSQALSVKVAASDGVGVAGVPVSFSVASGGGSVSSGSVTSDASGNASTSWKLGTTVGAQSVTASAGGLSGSPITFGATATAAVATKLVVTSSPGSGVAGAALGAFVVTAQDANGNVATGFTGTVSVGLSGGAAGAALGGTASVTAVAGVASFSSLTINKVGTGYALTAGSGALTAATSSAFDIVAGPAAVLVFTGQPSSALANASIGTIVVNAQDAQGNPTPAFTGTVSLSLASNPGAGVLGGGASAAAVAGVATFTGLTISQPGVGYAIAASASGVAGAVSASFNITGGVVAQLVFTAQPTNTTVPAAISPAITVTAKDVLNNVITTFTSNVTLSFGANPGGSTLGGTVTVAAVAGVATFNGITVNKAGVGYTLVASSGILAPGVSNTFNIIAGPATTMAISSGQAQSGAVSALLPAPLTVLVTDVNANPVAGRTINWAIATGGGTVTAPTSVTNAAGLATMTWTLGPGAGAQSVTAASIGLAGTPLTFTANATVGTANKVWTGATSTAWATASNWSPVGVPVGTDSVSVPLVTNLPQLSASTTVADLYLSTGATLTLTSGAVTLTVNGTLDATGGILGTGNVSLGGAPGRTLKGVITGALTFGGTYSLNGAFTVAGNTVINTGGALTLNGQTFANAGSFTTAGTGTLTMTNAADILAITGAATFGGGNETGLLAAGNMSVTGNFSQTTSSTAFVAGAAHNTLLTGSATQTVSFANPFPSGFGTVTFANPAGFTVTSSIYTYGAVTVTSGAVTGATSSLSINGTLTDPSGGLHMSGIAFGGGSPAISATTPAVTVTTGSVTFNAATTLAGNLTINGPVNVNSASGVLTPNGHTLTINGDLATLNNGSLVMNNAGDVINVNGNATFGGGAGTLTNGALNVTKNFTQSTTANAFAATPPHTTTLNGTTAQTVNFANPGTSGFGGVVFSNAAGVAVTGNVVANGPVTVTTGGVTGAGALSVNGTFTDASSGFNMAGISFGGGSPAISATTPVLNTSGGGSITFNAATSLGANLTINGGGGAGLNSAAGVLTLNGHTLTVNGNFGTNNGATIVMTNAADLITVNGNATFSGGTNTLTNGVISISGNFTQNTAATSYTATATHKTRFTGATPAISFANPTTSWFGRLEINSASGATYTFSSDVQTTGAVWLQTGGVTSITNSGHTFSIGGSLYDSTGGRWQATNTVMFPNNPAMPKTLATNLTFSGIVALTDSLKLTGGANTLTVNSGSLTLSGHKVVVTGAFSTTGTGVLVMQNAADSLIVHGNALFTGGSTTGLLTNGYLEVDGSNFFQGTNATAFAADAPHITWFWGSLAQTVGFANPGLAGASHFGNLYLQDTATVLNSGIFLNGELQTGGQSSFKIRAASDQLVTSNGSNLRNVVFDNVRWKLSGTNGNALFPSLDNVTFQNISATTMPQFDFEYSVTTNLTLAGFTFNTVPTGGGSYIKIVGPDTLTMSGVSPGLTGGFTNLSGFGAILGWSNTATWTGAATTSAWNTAGNWSTNAVPAATTDVVINSGIYQPSTGGAVTVHNLTVNSGATLTVSGANMTVNGDITVQPAAKIDLNTTNVGVLAYGNVTTDTAGTTGVTTCAGPSSPAMNLQAGTHNVTGKFCNLNFAGNYTATGPIQVVGSGSTGGLSGASGNLTFNGQRVDVVSYSVSGTATLTMQNAADLLFIHGGSVNFTGGSETGLMTNGTIFDRAPNFIINGTGYDASGGSQTVVVDTSFFQTLTQNSAATPGHGFNNVTMKGTSSKGFSGDQWITGTLLFDVSMVGPGNVQGSYNIHVNTLIDNSTGINGGAFQGSTSLHMTGTTPFNRDTLIVNTLFIDHGQTFALAHNLVTNYVVVDSNSTLSLNGHTVNLQGNYFTTQHGGMLSMTNASDSLVASQFYFNGGSTYGLLTAGAINVTGPVAAAFFQGYIAQHTAAVGTSATAFAPTGTRVWLNPSFSTFMEFANPGSGATGSHFWFVQATNGAPVNLLTNIVVDSLLLGEVSGDTWQSDSAAQNVPRNILTAGIYNSGTYNLALNAVTLFLNDGVATSSLINATWTNFGTVSSGALFTQNRTSAPPSLNSLTYTVGSFTGTGQFVFNAGSAPLTLGLSITPSTCASASYSNGQGCH